MSSSLTASMSWVTKCVTTIFVQMCVSQVALAWIACSYGTNKGKHNSFKEIFLADLAFQIWIHLYSK